MSVVLEKPEVDAGTIEAGQRMVLDGVDWAAFEALGEALRDRPGLRLTYDRGTLEIMTTSSDHERYKKRLGRIVETLLEEFGILYVTAGAMTFKRPELERGMEPDDCFWIEHEPHVRDRLRIGPSDPPPDLAIEIEVSRTVLDRLGIYAAMGIPEVWRFNGSTIRILRLEQGQYVERAESPVFPGILAEELAPFARWEPGENYAAVFRALRALAQQRRAEAGRSPKTR
jgi:Uma2 family endonuclease